jgi:hypothetical protein
MKSRHAVKTVLLIAIVVTPSYSGRFASGQPANCAPSAGGTYHGQLPKPLSSYTYTEFAQFAGSLNWLDNKGVNSAPRRADCGPACIYKGPGNERDDEPARKLLVSNHPICDAGAIQHLKLPDNGVLIGRLTHMRELPPRSRAGDASFNVRRATPGNNPGRHAEHYVIVFPGRQFKDRATYAIWRIVTILDRSDKPVAPIDSGLFRVCLPKHPTRPDTLASFRSCAEVSEFHDLSVMPAVQRMILGDQVDSALAQREVFARLVLADSGALARLRTLPDSILFAPPARSSRENEDHFGATHGPFARATQFDVPSSRRLFRLRYGELHIDAPLWYTCAEGCCSGEPY